MVNPIMEHPVGNVESIPIEEVISTSSSTPIENIESTNVMKAKIMIANDNTDAFYGIRKHMEGNGHRVKLESDLGVALREIRGGGYGVILLDAQMDGSVTRFADQVKSHNENIKIFMYSGLSGFQGIDFSFIILCNLIKIKVIKCLAKVSPFVKNCSPAKPSLHSFKQ